MSEFNEKDASFDPSSDPNVPEMESITNRLIYDTLGVEGVLEKDFQEMMNGYSRDSNPIGMKDAKDILFKLIELAISQRNLLPGRIEASIDKGGYSEQFYRKMHEINVLSVKAYEKMREMQKAREEYEYNKAIRDKVVARSYVKDFLPDDISIESDVADMNIEIVAIEDNLDREGGLLDAQDNEWN